MPFPLPIPPTSMGSDVSIVPPGPNTMFCFKVQLDLRVLRDFDGLGVVKVPPLEPLHGGIPLLKRLDDDAELVLSYVRQLHFHHGGCSVRRCLSPVLSLSLSLSCSSRGLISLGQTESASLRSEHPRSEERRAKRPRAPRSCPAMCKGCALCRIGVPPPNQRY